MLLSKEYVGYLSREVAKKLEEGKFDFVPVDGLIQGAREHNLRLVLLWFGSWKNTYSSYVPAWVKRDEERFPRVQLHDGRGTGGGRMGH